ncbi:MAG: hypothetical protein AABX79_02865 [Nanoarchaeota archaeon]
MENSFKEKGIFLILAVVAFFTGFLFVDRGGISGNTILDGSYPVSTVSMVGLVLVICSIILGAFAIRSK